MLGGIRRGWGNEIVVTRKIKTIVKSGKIKIKEK